LELSPTTFDDLLEAALRNNWKRWTSDTNSAINLDHTAFNDGFFLTRCVNEAEDEYNHDKNFGARRLLDIGTPETAGGMLKVPAGCVVHELTCGSKDIKYSLLKKFGGVDGEDLYQEFKHIAVNTLSLSVQIGAIVTGSFGMMGTNNPKLMTEDVARANFGGEDTDRFEDGETTGNSFIENLPVKSTDTDQFTSREGDLWINGKNITFATNLTLELNNGLEKKYAIFVKDAISTQPLSLDITGDLTTYLVAGYSDELYNSGIDDETNEIIFQFQNKEKDPDFIYLFQIFQTKIGDQNLSASGADTFDQSEPWNSFGERALRIFRVALPKVRDIEFNPSTAQNAHWYDQGSYTITPNAAVVASDITGKINVLVSGKNSVGEVVSEQVITSATVDDDGLIHVEESTDFANTVVLREVEVTLNGETKKMSFAWKEQEAPDPVTDVAITVKAKKATFTWTDSVSTDADHVLVDVQDNTGASVVSASVPVGEETYTATGLTVGATYDVDFIVVDGNGNKSTKVSKTFQTSDITLGSVSNLAAAKDGSDVKVTWVDPSSDLTGVRITVFEGDTQLETSDVVKTTQTYTITSTLESGHSYKVTAVPYKTLEDAVLLGTTQNTTYTEA
jgi:hypothetical protein